MATWVFEPGHTAAEFRARHTMVCWVRGHFKDVHGSLEFDPDHPTQPAIKAALQAARLWTRKGSRPDPVAPAAAAEKVWRLEHRHRPPRPVGRRVRPSNT
jgi:hypothetical protein